MAFADDMLVLSNQKGEIEKAINEMASLQVKFNLRLNKKKSEILTAEKVEHIGEIRCVRMVKYLGVKVNIDAKLQKKNCQGTDLSKLEFLEMETEGCGARCCTVTFHAVWHDPY